MPCNESKWPHGRFCIGLSIGNVPMEYSTLLVLLQSFFQGTSIKFGQKMFKSYTYLCLGAWHFFSDSDTGPYVDPDG